MDAFPEDYVVHNLPLLLISGVARDGRDTHVEDGHRSLLHEGGFRLRIDLPSLTGPTAQQIEEEFLQHDSTKVPWNSRHASQSDKKSCFQIKSIGRMFTLPPRKAPPPAHSPLMNSAGGHASPPTPLVLHSVLSPLSPPSPLYADGIMTPLWVTKHQSRLPSSMVTFFSLSSDPETSALVDNKIKSEISNIRSVFTSANYKTKTIFVLVGEAALNTSDAEDRVSNIRRTAALDSKQLFFLPDGASSAKISEFVKLLLHSLQAASIEYYRDISKHARRKRNRNTVPAPTVPPSAGTSQPLSLPAWIVRYEFKLGVFAEFRQEMDAAFRNYETAYEHLLGQEVLELIPSWSPRFNEARLLADAIVIRMIRCLLWNGQTTSAVKWWSNHRARMSDFIERRGAGTETYGWQGWQSTWAKLMADLIRRAQIHATPGAEQTESVEKSILVHSEKTLSSTERFTPWESLHHEGYWLNLAQKYTNARRARAREMPQEDRASPDESPASAIASREHLYDKYLALEPYKEFPASGQPGYDYESDIIRTINAAVGHFSDHSQMRMIRVLQLRKAVELMRSLNWESAILVLRPLWQDPRIRKEGWVQILREIGRALSKCATEIQDAELQAQTVWELVHPLLAAGTESGIQADETSFAARVKDLSLGSFNVEERLSTIDAHVAFAAAEGHVDTPVIFQLSLHRLGSSGMSVTHLNHVQILFEGQFPSIVLTNKEQRSGREGLRALILEPALHETPSTVNDSDQSVGALTAEVDLTLYPGDKKIYQFQIVPRYAGEVSATSITMKCNGEHHEATFNIPQGKIASEFWWESRRGQAVGRLHGKGRDVAVLKLLPRPPKLEIEIPNLRKAYYTNEAIELKIDYCNFEDDILHGTVEARMLNSDKDVANLRWNGDETSSALSDESTKTVESPPQQQIQNLPAGGRFSNGLTISSTEHAVDHEVEIIVTYTLPSNPYTILRKQMTLDIPVVRPFEVHVAFHPRYNDEDWPSFFSMDNISQDKAIASGLKQSYKISALLRNLAVENLVVLSAGLTASRTMGNAVCSTGHGVPDTYEEGEVNNIQIQPEQSRQLTSDMTIQKISLNDRQSVAVDFIYEVRWKRATSSSSNEAGSDKVYITTLPIPRFLAPSSEPRVLLRFQRPSASKTLDADVFQLIYTIENPSLHFLTFNVTMESSEDFAFSGPKSTSVSLVPISRHDIHYRIVPTVPSGTTSSHDGGKAESSVRVNIKSKEAENRHEAVVGQWMKVHLNVVDAYFGQTLRVQPASDGIKIDKQGNALIRFN